MEAIELDGTGPGLWDHLVEESAQGTVFQTSDWLALFKKHFNLSLKVYGCYDEGRLAGGCAIFVKRNGLFKEVVSTINMMPYGGVIFSKYPGQTVKGRERMQWEVMDALIDALARDHFHRVTLRNSTGLTDIRPFTWAGWASQVLYTYHLPLDNITKNCMDRLARRNIRKGKEHQFLIKKLSDPAIHFRLFEMTLKRKGIAPYATKGLFEDVLRGNGRRPLAEMWVAETLSGEVVSSQLIAHDRRRAYVWSEATHTDHRDSGANSLLQYEVLRDLAERGFTEVDLTRANFRELAAYAAQLNPSLVPFYVVAKPGMWSNVVQAIGGPKGRSRSRRQGRPF